MSGGLWNNEQYAAQIKIKMLLNQSKAKLDVKILFGKTTHCLQPNFGKWRPVP